MPAANETCVRSVGLSKIERDRLRPGERLGVVRLGLEPVGQGEHLGLLGRARGRRRAGSAGSRLVSWRLRGLVEDGGPGGEELVDLVVGETSGGAKPEPRRGRWR